ILPAPRDSAPIFCVKRREKMILAKDLIEESQQFIKYEKDKKNKIATVTFNRPEYLNALTVGMRLIFADIVHKANIDDDVKVLVIRSEGDHFGTGADLAAQFKGYKEGPNNSPLHEFRIDDDPSIKYPPDDSFRYIHGVCELYSKPISGCRSLQT